MRIGILGGTFDPIHIGHLRIAEEICDEMELEKVFLIPGAIPPHKDKSSIAPFDNRLAMAQMAVEESSHLSVLDLEGRRKGFSYSIETLKEIHQLFGPDLEVYFIIGIDAFMEIQTWKDYKQLFDFSNFIVLKRPGFPFEELEQYIVSLNISFKKGKDENSYISLSGHIITYKEIPLIDISSTNIRELVSAGKSISFLVPEKVRSYILKMRLYENYGKY